MAHTPEGVSIVTENPSWMKKWAVLPIERQEYAGFVQKGKPPFRLDGLLGNKVEFPEEELNAVYLWWRKFEDTKALMVRFALAVRNELLPPAEKRRAEKIFTPVRKAFEAVIAHLQVIKEKGLITNEEAKAGAVLVEEFEEYAAVTDQAIALCEAINESQLKDPLKIRQLIAQHAMEELSNGIMYENLVYAGDADQSVVMADDLVSEKRELLAALMGEFWSKKEIVKMRKLYERWRRQIKNVLEDDEANDLLSLLWNPAVGRNITTTTAFAILEAQSQVFDILQGEGLLEFELPEEEDEEDSDSGDEE